MNIGGDLSQNKCDRCDSFLVWNEYGSSRSDESQLEEVCEECEKLSIVNLLQRLQANLK